MKNKKEFLVKSALILSLIGALSTGCKKQNNPINVNIDNVKDITDEYNKKYIPNTSNITEVINGDTLPAEYSDNMYIFNDLYTGTKEVYKVNLENGKISSINNIKIILRSPSKGISSYSDLDGLKETGINKEEMERLRIHYENDFRYLNIEKVETTSFYRGKDQLKDNDSLINGFVYYSVKDSNVFEALTNYFDELNNNVVEVLDMSIDDNDYQVSLNNYGKVIDVKIYDIDTNNGQENLEVKELAEFDRQNLIDILNDRFSANIKTLK